MHSDVHKKMRSGDYGFFGYMLLLLHYVSSAVSSEGGVFCMKIIPISLSLFLFNNRHSPSVKCRDMLKSIPSIHDNDEEIILWLQNKGNISREPSRGSELFYLYIDKEKDFLVVHLSMKIF